MLKKTILTPFILLCVVFSLFSAERTTSDFCLFFEKEARAQIGFYADEQATQELMSIDFNLKAEPSPLKKRVIHKTVPFYIGWNISEPGFYRISVYSTSDYTNTLNQSAGYSLVSINGIHKMNLMLSDISRNRYKFTIGTRFNTEGIPGDWQPRTGIAASKRTYSIKASDRIIAGYAALKEIHKVELIVRTNNGKFMAGPFSGYLLLVVSSI